MAQRGKVNKKENKEDESRPFRPKRYDKFILIVCEDQNTEPYYFKKIKECFPEKTVYLKEIGTGKKPKGIIETAISERDNLATEINKSVDEVWVVFDKDDEGNNATTLASFNQAWQIAEKENICIAFSNEVFELWLLLHFIDINYEQALSRVDIYDLLEKNIKKEKEFNDFVYQHGKSEIIDILIKIGDESKAIVRSEDLLIKHKIKKPIDANPSTYMHILVKHLRELIDWYSYSIK